MSKFYLVHTTLNQFLIDILKDGYLMSRKELEQEYNKHHKMKITKTSKTNMHSKLYDTFEKNIPDNLGGDSQYIYTTLLPKSFIDNDVKEFDPMNDILLVFDAALLLDRNFAFNITWSSGVKKDTIHYNKKNYKTITDLDNILTDIYERTNQLRQNEVKKYKIKEFKDMILRQSDSYGEILFKDKINLQKYLKFICIRFRQNDINNYENITNFKNTTTKKNTKTNKSTKSAKSSKNNFLFKLIKYSNPYINTNIILYKRPKIENSIWFYFDNLPTSQIYNTDYLESTLSD